MNKFEIAALLTIIGGFDNRKVDDNTINSWYLVPGIREADFEDAKAAAVAHVTGAQQGEYLMVGHIVAATQVSSRQTRELIAADVRSARARGMVPSNWPESDPVPADVFEQLTRIRAESRAVSQALAIEVGDPWER
jgi:hypothetical protein